MDAEEATDDAGSDEAVEAALDALTVDAPGEEIPCGTVRFEAMDSEPEPVSAQPPPTRNESHLPVHQEIHASCQRKGPSGLARFVVACTECSIKAESKVFRKLLLDSGTLPALLRRDTRLRRLRIYLITLFMELNQTGGDKKHTSQPIILKISISQRSSDSPGFVIHKIPRNIY